MSRIEKCFQEKSPFIGYLTVGDGGLDYSEKAALAMIDGGIDILEIGMPFTDPLADGPVIQKAMERSLKEGTTAHDLLAFISNLRKKTEIPLVLFGYYNPILKMGDAFFEKAKNAGVDGLLVVDLAFDEGQDFFTNVKNYGMDSIFVVTPSTSPDRIKVIDRQASGFLYYACVKGTTGMRDRLPEDFHDKMKKIKKFTHLPVACGFGISNQEQALDALKSANGFVVGSYFVKAMGEKASPETLKQMVKTLDPR